LCGRKEPARSWSSCPEAGAALIPGPSLKRRSTILKFTDVYYTLRLHQSELGKRVFFGAGQQRVRRQNHYALCELELVPFCKLYFVFRVINAISVRTYKKPQF